jgi:hypothetical protein
MDLYSEQVLERGIAQAVRVSALEENIEEAVRTSHAKYIASKDVLPGYVGKLVSKICIALDTEELGVPDTDVMRKYAHLWAREKTTANRALIFQFRRRVDAQCATKFGELSPVSIPHL